MKYSLQYTKSARYDLDRMDKKIAIRVISKIDFYCSQRNPLEFASALTGQLKGLYRFRIGEYRAIFHKDARGKITMLTILRIKHRKDIYR